MTAAAIVAAAASFVAAAPALSATPVHAVKNLVTTPASGLSGPAADPSRGLVHAAARPNDVAPLAVAPTVTVNPAGMALTGGGTASFKATASGTKPIAVQWQVSTDGGTAWTGIAGATSDTYTTPPTALNDSGRLYRAVFANTAGTAASTAAHLTVNPAAPVITKGPGGRAASGRRGATSTAAAPPPAFSCLTPTIFVAQGTTATQLYGETYALGTAVFTPIGGQWTGNGHTTLYNAIGFNTADRLLYGVSEWSSALNGYDLLQTGSDGSVDDLGTISGLPTDGEFINNGAFFNGNFYIMSYNHQTLYKVDVATLVATPIPLSQQWTASDFTQVGNALWGIVGGNFERVDPVTGQVSFFPNTILSSIGGAGGGDAAGGAVFTFGNGNFGISSSDTGVVSQVSISNPDSATPVITLVSQSPGPLSQRNDGAVCVPTPNDTDLAVTKSGPAQVLTSGTITWTLTVTNNGPAISSGYTVTDHVPAGVASVASGTAGCTVVGNTVTCVGPALLVGDTNTITITGTAPSTDGTCVTNDASVLANENDPDQGNNTSGQVQTCAVATAAPAVTVAKSTTTASVTRAGQQVPYSFLVTNSGNVTLTSVAVTDTVAPPSDPAGLSAVTCPDTTLAPGGSTTCTATYTVTQADIDHGSVDDSATASGTPPSGPVVTSAPSTASVPAAQAAAITVVKSASPGTVHAAGDVVTYNFAVTNAGNVTLHGITVADTQLPPASQGNLSTVTCLATTLAPGASTTCTATYAVTQADIDHGSVDDSATASGTPPSGPVVTSAPSTALVPAAQAAAITVAKSASPGTVHAAGDVVAYSFLVTNAGNVTLHGITVADTQLPPASQGNLSTVTCLATTLAPGQSTTCTGTYTVTQADMDHGSVNDTATATGSPPSGPAVTSAPSAASVTTAPAPGISIVKSASASDVAHFLAGQVITYSFVVTNTGNVTLAPVTVTDTGFTGTGSLSPVSCPPGGTGTITSLAPRAQATCTATYTLTTADVDAGHLADTGVATGTPPSGPHVTADSPLDLPAAQNPAITIVKSASPAAVHAAGDVISYQFLATNTGNVTLTSVAVTDAQAAPAGSLDGPVTCPDTTLAPGQSTTCTATYTVTQADMDHGSVNDTATASGSPPSGPPVTSAPSAESVPAPAAPALSVVKSAPSAQVRAAGDVIGYAFLVTNTGNVTLRNVAVDDVQEAPAGSLDGPVTCPGTTLAPGQSVTCTATYTVTQADIDNGSVDDTATATGSPPSGPPETSPPSTASVPAPQAPQIAIVKSATPAQVDAAGDVVSYQFTVTDTGNETLTSVAVSDVQAAPAGALDGPVTCPVTTLAPGQSVTCTGTYTVTQADIDNGSVNDTATATGSPPSGPALTSEPVDVSVPAPAAPALSVVKSAAPAQVHKAGEVISYQFLVTNTGNVTLTSVAVSDVQAAPAGALDGPVTCPDTTLAPGTSTTCTATYTVTQADVDNGSVDDTATASGTPPSGPPATSPPSAASVPAPNAPAITVVKSAPQAPVTHAGQQLRYSFLVTNTGNVTLHDVTVTDTVAPPSDPAKLSRTTCPQATLAPGAKETCTATYTVTQADEDHSGPVRDTATVTGTPPATTGDPHPAPLPPSPPSAATVPVAQAPGLRIVKTAATEQVTGDPAEVIRYQFTLANTGNLTLTNIGVSDPLLAAEGITVRCPHPTLAPGKSETCASSRPYTVTKADAARGSVTNTADAHARTPSGHLIRSAPSTVTTTVTLLAALIPTGEGASTAAPGTSPGLAAAGAAALSAGMALLLRGRRRRRAVHR